MFEKYVDSPPSPGNLLDNRMKIFDSHCHLDDRIYSAQLDNLILRAHQAQVMRMMTVGIDEATSRRAVAIARSYDSVDAAVGVHPHDAQACTESILADLAALAADPNVKAWGEIGLDFNRMYSPVREQEYWFSRQLEIGAELGLPMIFHERDSQGRFLDILKHHWSPTRQAVVHCFSGSMKELETYLEMGLHIGITGILTIAGRGKKLRKMVGQIPAERLLVETDAPYLTPAPERNKFRHNESAFVRTVLLKLAQVRQQDPGELAEIVWENTCRLFRIEL
jgi:TatD DNase family protein